MITVINFQYKSNGKVINTNMTFDPAELPDWSKYIVIDAYGDICLFELEPIAHNTFWIDNNPGRIRILLKLHSEIVNWKDTKHELIRNLEL